MKGLIPIAVVLLLGSFSCNGLSAPPTKETAIRRGAKAVWQTHSPLAFTEGAYDNLWKQWGLKKKPKDFGRIVRERYGLHEAPYENNGMPMGLHRKTIFFAKGIANDCLLCHAGTVAGQTVIGIGNASLDLQSLFEDLEAGDITKPKVPFRFSHARGTIEAAAATIYLLSYRDSDLNLKAPIKLKIPEHLCEDVPAWWHLKRKKTMYHSGATDSRSVRSLMAFLLSPTNSAAFIKKQLPKFRDIQAYIRSLAPPKYPFSIDEKKATAGKQVFERNCQRCHGSYGPDGKYPNKVIPLKVIGTDPSLAGGDYPEKDLKHLVKAWVFSDMGPNGEKYHGLHQGGYQAPPLDGVWASAPYLHNGSVPTVYHLLNSKSRPKIFTRSYKTDKSAYDAQRLGWKITALKKAPGADIPKLERRKVYDTTQPGRGNGGHFFGDKLTEKERQSVIEYLKSL